MPKETGLWDSTTRLHLYLSVLLTFYIVKKQQTFSSLWFYIHYYLLRSYVLCIMFLCCVKKVFLEILQNSQENTCARAFFNKVAGLRLLL